MQNTTSKTFLDANVLLEIILGRSKQSIARQSLEIAPENLKISALTAHLVMHFGTAVADLPVLREFLADYEILDLSAADIEWAFNNARNNDFEDALQLAVAIRNGCNEFVTFDRQLQKDYASLPIINIKVLS